MDPNENLAEQEDVLESIETTQRVQENKSAFRDATESIGLHRRLSDLRLALSDWLAREGAEPDWSKAPRAARYYGKLVQP